jgi:GNAT superfamily N-acetyltransferase
VTETTEPRVERFATAAVFLESAGAFLGEREAEHNLLFGICANLTADPGFPTAAPYLATVARGRRVTAAAIMTPPWNVVLSWTDDPAAIEALAADLDAAGIPVPGTTGPVEAARAFAGSWCARHGLTSWLAVAERIYRLERVVPPVGVPGRVRIATEADRDLLVGWVDAFLAEAMHRATPEEASVLVDRSFRAGTRTWYLWEDAGRPVSVAASGGPTPNGIRIGPVYTPPELRRRGYASAVTAAASQAELDRGRRFIFLFTDLSNPTSNKIYRQIGYEPVIDIDQLAFVPGAAAR